MGEFVEWGKVGRVASGEGREIKRGQERGRNGEIVEDIKGRREESRETGKW